MEYITMSFYTMPMLPTYPKAEFDESEEGITEVESGWLSTIISQGKDVTRK